jgi:hypothetical protein
MSAKAIWEVTGKALLAQHLPEGTPGRENLLVADFGHGSRWEEIEAAHPFLNKAVRAHESLPSPTEHSWLLM